MMTRGGEGGKKCPKFDDVICERPLREKFLNEYSQQHDKITIYIIDAKGGGGGEGGGWEEVGRRRGQGIKQT